MLVSCDESHTVHRGAGVCTFGGDVMAEVAWNVALHHAFVLQELCVCVTGCNDLWYTHVY